MYFWEEQLVQAALDVGIRAVVTPGILAVPAWEEILGRWDRRTSSLLDFCRQWQGHEGRISTGLGPHAPYTLPLPALAEIASEARRNDLLVHTHLVETSVERDTFNRQGIGSTAAALEGIGFFDGPVLAAHSIWVDPGDIEIYARKGVGVAHCPGSNAKLGAGIAPLAAMLAAGVRVGLGTDGAATNNDHDLWQELQLAPLFAKALALDPKPVPAGQALWMATRIGALAIQLPEIGVLREGMKADIVSVKADDAVFAPIFSPGTYVGHLVYAGGSRLVDSVWVNGRRVVRDGDVLTVDEEVARRSAQNAAMALSARMAA
jgi:5-methylthioadenosine/S-adenosylhomocysteine deaminase